MEWKMVDSSMRQMRRQKYRGLLGAAWALLTIAALICLVFSGNRLLAQVAGTRTIQGTITDPSGAVVVGAEVVATEPATGRSTS